MDSGLPSLTRIFQNSGGGYNIADDLTGFTEFTQEMWDKGYSLSNIEYAEDRWISVYGNDFGGGAYSTSDSLTGFKSAVNSRRRDGFDLIAVEYAQDNLG